uniref:Myelin regulatory factor-like n=1 Tax=Phallusia mammillata TaxID=59560 RepID=A0A6F9DL52_9ASCI|nr:myelin regulatory factor-like [Phallusia mammillata]
MTEYLRNKPRVDTFNSLHAETEGILFPKEEIDHHMLNNDGENIHFESEIADLAELITKGDTDLPVDITNIHPLESSSQNICDIYQLHGDQQQEQHQKRVKVTGNYQQQRLPHEQNAIHIRKFGGIQQEDPRFQTSCLPDSPPDSGSEPYSPPQEAHNSKFNLSHRVFQTTNQIQPSPSRDYRHDQYRGSGTISSPTGSNSSYEHSPTHQFDSRSSMEGVHHGAPMIEYNAGTNESQYISGGQRGLYADDGMKSMTSSLSPGSSSSDGSVHSGIQVVGYTQGAPATKKRKHSSSPPSSSMEPLNATLLNQQYQHMIQHQIKQEPDLLPSPGNENDRRGYYNNAYEMTETQQAPAPVRGNHPLTIPHPSPEIHNERPLAQSQFSDNNGTYQVIKWSPFIRDTWSPVFDGSGNELQTMSYRVDADKGFNFAVSDDTFVCQKKNHFQVTVHIGVVGHPCFIKTDGRLQQIEAFYINLYGVKYESQNQTIAIEQSQSDRSKKAFHPVKVDLPGDQVTKVTIGRLHFSETTTNNMRKKGRPNPDQRYFMCIVALYAQCGNKSYTVAAAGTEKIIVRASNPGQFDQDDIQWQRAQLPDAIYHHGRVGINYDHPDEALVVHGNIKLTGHLMQPSDKRAKEGIQEVDTETQLKNVSNIRICKYQYSPEYAMHAGIDSNRVETGVIAQELACVMPEAVRETGDVQLENGETIPNFLVVDKDRLYMENVGAVKQIYKLTTNFEERIDELERWNKKLKRTRKYDSFRSNISGLTTPSVSREGSVREPSKARSSRTSSNSSSRARKPPSSRQSGTGCMSNRFVQAMVIALVVIMAFSVVAMSTLYIVSMSHKDKCTDNCSNGKDTVSSDSSTNTSYKPVNSTSSVMMSSTTLAPSPNNKSPPPIKFCPITFDPCTEQLKFCCTDAPAGQPMSAICLRALPVARSELKYLIPNTNAPRTTVTTERRRPQPREFPGSHKHKNKNPGVGDGYYDTGDMPNINPIISMENNSPGGKEMDGSSPLVRPHLVKVEPQQTGGKMIPSKVAAAKKKRKKARIDDVTDLEADRHQVHNINRRAVSHNIPEVGLFVADIVSLEIVEPNITLHDASGGETSYALCETHLTNYTYSVPVAPETPQGLPFTLKFSLRDNANIVRCKNTGKDLCPNTEASDEEVITRSGKDVDFTLNFSDYITTDYMFRVTTLVDLDGICQYETSDAGTSYTEFNLHFYRTCSTAPTTAPPAEDVGFYYGEYAQLPS